MVHADDILLLQLGYCSFYLNIWHRNDDSVTNDPSMYCIISSGKDHIKFLNYLLRDNFWKQRNG